MNRVAAIILMLCLLLTALPCAAEEPAMTCEALAQTVLQSATFRELTDMTERYLEKYLIISAEDLDEWVFKRDATRATPEMVLILKVRDGADQAAIRQGAQDLLDEQLLLYRDYQPAEVFKLENAKVVENGPFVALIVSPEPLVSLNALGSGWY